MMIHMCESKTSWIIYGTMAAQKQNICSVPLKGAGHLLIRTPKEKGKKNLFQETRQR